MKNLSLNTVTATLALALAMAAPTPAVAQWRKNLTPQERASLAGQVYLLDLLEQKPYATLWRNTVWNHVPNKRNTNFSWLKGGGTSGPLETVQIDGQTFYKAELCKPHACTDDIALVLINKQKVVVLQLYALPLGNVANGKKMQKLYGQPTEAERRYLKTWVKDWS